MVNLTWNARFDPDIADAKGRRIDRLVLKEKRKTLVHDRLQCTIEYGVHYQTDTGCFFGKKEEEQPNPQTPRARPTVKDDLLGWFDDFRVSHNISLNRLLIPTGYGTARDTFLIGRNTMSLAGSIPLSSKWSINISNITYDIQSKQLVYP